MIEMGSRERLAFTEQERYQPGRFRPIDLVEPSHQRSTAKALFQREGHIFRNMMYEIFQV